MDLFMNNLTRILLCAISLKTCIDTFFARLQFGPYFMNDLQISTSDFLHAVCVVPVRTEDGNNTAQSTRHKTCVCVCPGRRQKMTPDFIFQRLSLEHSD